MTTVKYIHLRENGLVEYICKCGVGHPSKELTPPDKYYGVHGCCGCCGNETFKPTQEQVNNFKGDKDETKCS